MVRVFDPVTADFFRQVSLEIGILDGQILGAPLARQIALRAQKINLQKKSKALKKRFHDRQAELTGVRSEELCKQLDAYDITTMTKVKKNRN